MLKTKAQRKQRRQLRIRRKIVGTAERPRLGIRRSLRHITAVVSDDRSNPSGSITLIQLSTDRKALGKETGGSRCNQQWAAKLGAEIAARATEKNITCMVFDRGGMKYHGVVKAFCDAVREGGIKI